MAAILQTEENQAISIVLEINLYPTSLIHSCFLTKLPLENNFVDQQLQCNVVTVVTSNRQYRG